MKVAALFVVLTVASVAGAQTCIPVTVNKTQEDANHDTGTGYYANFDVQPQGTEVETVPAGGTMYSTAAQLRFGPVSETGITAVPSGFGGCGLSDFTFSITHNFTVIDTTNHTTVINPGPERDAGKDCGKVLTCSFTYNDPYSGYPTQYFSLTAGDTYLYQDNLFASVNGVTQNSTTFHNSITIKPNGLNNFASDWYSVSGTLELQSAAFGCTPTETCQAYVTTVPTSNNACMYVVLDNVSTYSQWGVQAGPLLQGANGDYYYVDIQSINQYSTQVWAVKSGNANAMGNSFNLYLSTGDTLGFCSENGALTMTHNGTGIYSHTDGSPIQSLRSGAFFFNNTSAWGNGFTLSQVNGFTY